MKSKKMRGYRFLKGLLKPIFLAYYTPKIIGRENIPEKGPILICANHIHIMDQCMPIVVTKRDIKYMAKKEYFDGNVKWFFKMAGCISVDRSKKDVNATNQALAWLNSGGAIGIFPEGTRNKTKDIMLPFKFGAVSMAQKTGALIVPCGIYGTYKFRSKNLIAIIGKPYKIGKEENLKTANENLQKKVLDLILEGKKRLETKKLSK